MSIGYGSVTQMNGDISLVAVDDDASRVGVTSSTSNAPLLWYVGWYVRRCSLVIQRLCQSSRIKSVYKVVPEIVQFVLKKSWGLQEIHLGINLIHFFFLSAR